MDTMRAETGVKAECIFKMKIKFSREYGRRVQRGGGCMQKPRMKQQSYISMKDLNMQ